MIEQIFQTSFLFFGMLTIFIKALDPPVWIKGAILVSWMITFLTMFTTLLMLIWA